MSEFVFKNAFVSIDGNDLSDHVRQVRLRYEAETRDITAMGDNTRKNIGGLKNWSAEVEFNQDFAASNVDAVMFPLVGSTVTLIVRPDAGAVSSTNPNYTGSVVVESYEPLGGGVGDNATAGVSLVPAGDLSRATS